MNNLSNQGVASKQQSDFKQDSPILNIAAYRFVSLEKARLPAWQQALKQQAVNAALKGTILLSEEGINFFLAGSAENIAQFKDFLAGFAEFNQLTYRESWSESRPFQRLLVKIKKEIIAMGQPDIQPEKNAAPYIDPHTLREWFAQGRKMLVLDTRNQYEFEYGAFEQAVSLNLKNFRSFPQAAAHLPAVASQVPIVTFCTGGIRCEKAALWLKKQGYHQVYQLQGGILNYFTECGREFFRGDCFVFDERVII